MDGAAEIFTMQLARTAGKSAMRYLRKRGLQKADRDDIIAAALLWCWANRAKASLTTTVETWFMNAVRNAYQNFQRQEIPTADTSIEQLGTGDSTYNVVAAESDARALTRDMTFKERQIANFLIEGYTRREIIQLGYTQWDVDNTRTRVRKLRKAFPDKRDAQQQIARAAAPTSDDQSDRLSSFDQELQQLEFAPPAGKDCPPCWRCMWFEGFMPAKKLTTRMKIAEPEVREAVRNVEERKIKIAGAIRYGGLRQLKF